MYKPMLLTDQELKLLLEIIDSHKGNNGHNATNIHLIKRRITHLINTKKQV